MAATAFRAPKASRDHVESVASLALSVRLVRPAHRATLGRAVRWVQSVLPDRRGAPENLA
jgi:hypothetical protein